MSFCGKLSCDFADSSTVAEFIGVQQACKIIAWVQNLFSVMDVKLTQPATFFQDNEATIRILHNKSNEARIKYIALHYNMIREFIQEGQIIVENIHIYTDLMTADTLITALSEPAFIRRQIRLFLLLFFICNVFIDIAIRYCNSILQFHRANIESTDTAFYSVDYFIKHSVLYFFNYISFGTFSYSVLHYKLVQTSSRYHLVLSSRLIQKTSFWYIDILVWRLVSIQNGIC